tara:strand:- start:249 stop:482 length:234 start_codon:yes stop_codon:yes gene_type:complete
MLAMLHVAHGRIVFDPKIDVDSIEFETDSTAQAGTQDEGQAQPEQLVLIGVDCTADSIQRATRLFSGSQLAEVILRA